MNSDPSPKTFPLRENELRPKRRRSAHTTLASHGEPWVWLMAGSLTLALMMIAGLLGLIVVRGSSTFWPVPLQLVQTSNGRESLGEVTRREEAIDATGPKPIPFTRRLIRIANFEITGNHFEWIDDRLITSESNPTWATAVERLEGGRFHGFPTRLLERGVAVAEGPEAAWEKFNDLHPSVRIRWRSAMHLDHTDRGRLQRTLRNARLAVVQADLDYGNKSPQYFAAIKSEKQILQETEQAALSLDTQTSELREENAKWSFEFSTTSGETTTIPLESIVRAWQPNRIGLMQKMAVYASRWWEFLSDNPREANSAGGVFPAIWGTLAMTMIMALFVAPFGVLAALYLREYATSGPLTTFIRIAINNLAGVPSIVYGAFGLGFFCYFLGSGIDAIFFQASLVADNQPTFGTGGLLWASLTLALLTLPVVIVATEEALSSVPNSMREGSYACGAGKWQTIRRIVLPRALPGIMTGLILAMARGAGEVAPLMLVGVKKLAVDLPIDTEFPYIHASREFMHLSYLVYDVGFQSPNSQAAQPMVFTITFLLVTLIALLNISAIWIRARLKRRYVSQQF